MDDSDQKDPTKRFSNRVDAYIRYRPGYPQAVIDLLKKEYGLSTEHEIADIGAGVGHSALLFAPHVAYIYGIEPNEEMYNALVAQMAQTANFAARLQAAENTNLEARSVDFIICAQSYHWFSERMAKTEFERIINDEGYIVLMWNSRDRSSAFGQAYEQFLMDYAVDYKEVDHSRIGDEQFDYLMSTWKKFQFDNSQTLDLQGFLGRFTSSSYAPAPGTAAHSTASEALSAVFETFSHSTADGPRIELHYTTEVIIGKI